MAVVGVPVVVEVTGVGGFAVAAVATLLSVVRVVTAALVVAVEVHCLTPMVQVLRVQV